MVFMVKFLWGSRGFRFSQILLTDLASGTMDKSMRTVHVPKRYRFRVKLSREQTSELLTWADGYNIHVTGMDVYEPYSGVFCHKECVVSCGSLDDLLLAKLRWGSDV